MTQMTRRAHDSLLLLSPFTSESKISSQVSIIDIYGSNRSLVKNFK